MSNDIVIYRYHVDPQNGTATVEFRTKDPATGRLDPPIGYARHTVPISMATVQALAVELTPLLVADLAELPPQVLRSHAVTSELHALRDTRQEHQMVRNSIVSAQQEHAEHLVKIEEAKQEHAAHLQRIEEAKQEHAVRLQKLEELRASTT